MAKTKCGKYIVYDAKLPLSPYILHTMASLLPQLPHLPQDKRYRK